MDNFKLGIYRFHLCPQILINKFNHKLFKIIHITKKDERIPGKTIVMNLFRIKNVTKNNNYRNKNVPNRPTKMHQFLRTIKIKMYS
ncbi:hypothetical protein AMTRI_Chr02g262810 [Amborella trichopoda]